MKRSMESRLRAVEKKLAEHEKRLDTLSMVSHTEDVDWKEHLARAGKRGGESRAEKLTAEQRSEIARKGAKALWERRKRTISSSDLPRTGGASD